MDIGKIKNDDIEIQLEFLCIETVNLWRNKLGILAKEYNLSRLERRIIVFIGRYPSIRQAELATIMDVEPQSLTRALDAMEVKKWITKQDDAKDKRAKSLNLTEEGLKKLADAKKISESIRPRILKGLSSEDKENFARILTSMKENLKEIEGS